MAVKDEYFDRLEQPLKGKGFSDDELRKIFFEAVDKLEEQGDYDVLQWHVEGHEECTEKFYKVVYKVFKMKKISFEHLNAYQVFNLNKILNRKQYHKVSESFPKMKVTVVNDGIYWKRN
jgi:hypothetical protein